MQSAQFALHAAIEERHWWFVARRRIMRALVRQALPPSPSATVVDVGCGTGANLAALSADYRCVGIDTSADAIRLARERFPAIRFFCGRAPHDLGETVTQAKLFLLMDVLEHVPDDFALLSELLAAASPGALFLLTVPADIRLWSQHDESFGHYRRYDADRFSAAWQGLPVSTLLLSYYNSRLCPLVRLSRAWSRRRGHAAGAAGTDFKVPLPPFNRTLEEIFAGEARSLVRQLRSRNGQSYASGVSLIALLRRESGELKVRRKPAELAGDYYDPESGIQVPVLSA